MGGAEHFKCACSEWWSALNEKCHCGKASPGVLPLLLVLLTPAVVVALVVVAAPALAGPPLPLEPAALALTAALALLAMGVEGPVLAASLVTAVILAVPVGITAAGGMADDTRTDRRVRYERQFFSPEGKKIGMATFWALLMQRDESYTGVSAPRDLEQDGKVFFVDEDNGFERVEVPEGYFIPEDEPEDDFMY